MKLILAGILILIGLFVIYRGFTTLTFKARGETIPVLGFLIPTQDWSLYTFGAAFVLLGIANTASPLRAQKIMRRAAY
ncbi:hypothetical protein [Paenibacillus flagellatus]|uniref:hypothetical protein n=1 Tax=Paenibacillus flagellatus TaxID=2211139 RepID=UPI0011B46BFC|nr:hypothetical protein [Paenibacillus flagellatus]